MRSRVGEVAAEVEELHVYAGAGGDEQGGQRLVALEDDLHVVAVG
jgi:hypothetical protein